MLGTNSENDEIIQSENLYSTMSTGRETTTGLKTEFAKALAVALQENVELRRFIKDEALEKITYDYDVIYQVIKNEYVAGKTFRETILPYFETEDNLITIENEIPTLTIFVPDLKDDSFSAERWDVNSEIPMVAVRQVESNDVPIYDAEGNQMILPGEYMPDSPVLVIKENERVISNIEQPELFNNLDTNLLTQEGNSVQLKFWSNFFDNLFQFLLGPIKGTNPPNVPANRIDPIHQDAYNAYNNYTPGGWQRDFIYYGLTPTNTQGALNPTRREYLTSFKMSGSNALQAYYIISSNQDPQFSTGITKTTAWTDGAYEIGIDLLYGPKNSNLGNELRKGFGVDPEELFHITYIKMPGLLGLIGYKKPVLSGLKMIDFYNHPNKIEFSVWDLNNFANQWKLKFEEVDIPTKHVSTQSFTNKYNTNFSFDASVGVGDWLKIGLKYGSSSETSQTNNYTTERTDVSDNLSHADINFYDNVVDNINGSLQPRKYNTGWVEFEFRPRLVY